MKDAIGNADMKQGQLGGVIFTADRFGNLNEALNINTGYTYVDPGYYFTTPQFSISLWVYQDAVSASNLNSLIDFGNSNNYVANNDIILNTNSFSPALQIWNYNSLIVYVQSPANIFSYLQWIHLVATYDGVTANIYLNGSLVSSVKQSYSLPVLIRSSNYFGKYYLYPNNYYFGNTFLDDIRFYSISLTPNQILNIMNIPASCPVSTYTTAVQPSYTGNSFTYSNSFVPIRLQLSNVKSERYPTFSFR